MREEASPPTLGWHDLVIPQKFTTEKALRKAKERILRATDALVHLKTKESDLRQGFSNLIVHTNYLVGGRVLVKSRFWGIPWQSSG